MQKTNFKLHYTVITLPWYSRQVCRADKTVTQGLSEISFLRRSVAEEFKITSNELSTHLYLNYKIYIQGQQKSKLPFKMTNIQQVRTSNFFLLQVRSELFVNIFTFLFIIIIIIIIIIVVVVVVNSTNFGNSV
jgi:hypothetical protein